MASPVAAGEPRPARRRRQRSAARALRRLFSLGPRRALGFCALVLAAAAGVFPDSARAAEPVAVVTARVGGHADTTRLVLELTGHSDYAISRRANPDQVVIDLPGAVWSRAETARAGDGRIRRYHFEPTGDGGRLVLDTSGPTRVRTAFELQPQEGHPLRLVVDLETAPPPPQAPAVAAAPAPATPPPVAAHSPSPAPVAAAPLPVATGPAPDVVATRLAGHPDKTRFVLELSDAVPYRVTTAADPYRVLIHLPTLGRLEAPRSLGGRGVITDYRLEPEEGGTRAVLEAAAPVKLKTAFVLAPSEGYKSRLVLDVVQTDAAGFTVTEPAASAPLPRASAPPAPTPPPMAIPVASAAPAPPPRASAPPAITPIPVASAAPAVVEPVPPPPPALQPEPAPLELAAPVIPGPRPARARSAGVAMARAEPVTPPPRGSAARPVPAPVRIAEAPPVSPPAPAVATAAPVARVAPDPRPAAPVVAPVLVAEVTPPVAAPLALTAPVAPEPRPAPPRPTPAPVALSEAPAPPDPAPVAEPLPSALGTPGVDAPDEPVPSVIGARIGAYPDKTRFVLELSEPVRYQVDSESDPGRVVVHLPKLGPSAIPAARPGQGLIRGYRFEPDTGGGGSLAVLDTTGPVRLKSAFVIPPSEGHQTRLVLDMAPGDGVPMASTVLDPAPARPPAPARVAALPAPRTPTPAPPPAPTPPAPTPPAEVLADLPDGPLRSGKGDNQIAMLPATPPPAEAKRADKRDYARTITVPVTVPEPLPPPVKDKPVAIGGSSRDLELALSHAFAGNPTLGNARANLRAVDEGVSQARAQARPTAALTGSAGPSWSKSGVGNTDSNTTSTPNGMVRTTPKTVGLQVTQPIYKGGQIDAGIRQAENNVQAQRSALRDAEQTILLQAATNYLDVALDQALLELQSDFEAFQKRDLQALRDRFKAGEINQTDVSLQEAQLASASASRISAEGQLEADRATYIKLIGSPPGRLTLPTLKYHLPVSMEEAIYEAEAKTPKVVNAKFTESAAQDSVDVVDSALLPSVSVTANLGRNLDRSQRDDFSNAASVIANLTIPIDNGSNLARSRAARESANAARINIEQAVRAAREAAATAWKRLITARTNISYYETAVKANEAASSGIRQQIATGTSTIIDLLNTEQALLNARVNLFRAHHDESVAIFQILAATGDLDSDTIGLMPMDEKDAAQPSARKRAGTASRD